MGNVGLGLDFELSSKNDLTASSNSAFAFCNPCLDFWKVSIDFAISYCVGGEALLPKGLSILSRVSI